MDELEELTNTLADREENWWPFRHLRPRPEQSLTLRTIAPIAGAYGVSSGLVADILFRLAEEPLPFDHAVSWPIITTLLFAAVLHFPIAWAWNRRASLLQRRQTWGRTMRPVVQREGLDSLPAKDAQRHDEADDGPGGKQEDL